VKVTESFVVAESPPVLWEFLEQIDRVAWCVPGVEHVEVLDEQNSRLRIAQAIGPMTTTLDVRMQITERVPASSMSFTAIGRSVRGAAGHVRATNVIELSEEGPDSTRVSLAADIALGGMIGSVGQKAVAKQARKISQAFAESLQRELRGEPVSAQAPAAASSSTQQPFPAPAPAPSAPDGAGPAPATDGRPRTRVTSHLLAAVAGALAFASISAWFRRRLSQ
jgi:carbon monoxide dehydrogenase subunit G